MFFDLFGFGPNTYLKRASVLLQEAQMARIEQQAPAEHHGALARMYAERVKRLEAEVYRPRPGAGDEDPPSHPAELASLYSLDRKWGGALPSS